MEWSVVLHPEAADKLRSLPAGMVAEIRGPLNEWIADPEGRSRQATFPYGWGGPMFEFRFQFNGDLHHMQLFFLFADDADDRTLHVHDIVVRKLY